jgi:hypothetical protein
VIMNFCEINLNQTATVHKKSVMDWKGLKLVQV